MAYDSALSFTTTMVVARAVIRVRSVCDHAPAYCDGGGTPISGPICRDQDFSPMGPGCVKSRTDAMIFF